MKAVKQKKHPARSLAGFTLLELITVMGIIVAMTAVVVGSYSAIARSMAELAGRDTLRRAATLCRQHACIDGKDTYFFITGVDRFVLARRAGVLTTAPGTLSSLSAAERPPYDDSPSSAYWIQDKYTDLGAASISGSLIGFGSTTNPDNFSDMSSDLMVFNFTKGTFATVKYPPWYDVNKDAWVMGVNKRDSSDTFSKPETFRAGDQYGWVIYPEQRLPKGYAFVKGANNFIESGSFYFKPNGLLGVLTSNNPLSSGNGVKISIQELAKKDNNLSEIEIDGYGSIK